MDLPQELREKVYEGLLCPQVDRTKRPRPVSMHDYGLQPSILRTCKQICAEASRVLYNKNGIALIRVDPQAYRVFLSTGNTIKSKYAEPNPIARVECGKVGGEPVLTMDISVLDQYRRKPKPVTRKRAKAKSAPEEPFVFIGFLSALPRLYRSITSCLSPEILQLVINVERPLGWSSKIRQQMLSDYLECCCEARGLGRAVILTSPQNSDIAAKMADLMMTPFDSARDVLSIICAYESRAIKHMDEEKWNDAQDTLQNALDFFDWGRHYRNLKQELEEKKIGLQWNYIWCCLETGSGGDVHRLIRPMFQRTSQHPTPAQQTGYWDRTEDAHFAIGMAYVIDGALNSATHSFLQALLAMPGHVKTVRAINELEQRVKSSSKPEDVIAKLNIDRVLRDIRLQAFGQDYITSVQEDRIVKRFVATFGDADNMSQGSNSLVSEIQILACVNIRSDCC